MCGALFFGAVYGYLYYNINKKILSADEKDFETEYQYLPDSEGIGFLLPDSSAILVYLNFKENCINVVNIDVYDQKCDLYYGYTMDYIVEVDEQLIGGIVDRVGGVNVSVGGQTYRYTGSQVDELMKTVSSDSVKSQIISEIFKQISKNGFTRENFVYILQNAETNLTIIDCINWLGFIDKIKENIVFMD